MHKLLLPLVVFTSLAAGFIGGYYGALRVPVSAVVEDYAFGNVLYDVGYAHYLAKGELELLRSMLDVSLNEHLSKIRTNGGAVPSPAEEAARTRILNSHMGSGLLI